MSAERSDKPQIYTNLIICESVIRDKAEVLTAIRIANGFSQAPYKLTPQLPDGKMDEEHAHFFYPPIGVSLIATFHSEEPTRFTVAFRAITPAGKAVQVSKEPIPCEIPHGSDTHALNIRGNITTMETGIYWFEVYVDGQLATKAPLRITLRTEELPSSEESEDSNVFQQADPNET